MEGVDEGQRVEWSKSTRETEMAIEWWWVCHSARSRHAPHIITLKMAPTLSPGLVTRNASSPFSMTDIHAVLALMLT